MTTLRTTLGRWFKPLAGIWFIAFGVLSFPTPLGIFAVVVGICALCAS